MTYRAPLADIKHALSNVAGLQSLAGNSHFPNFDNDLTGPILEEAAKLTEGVLAPLNMPGDKQGATLSESGVIAAPGFKEAYAAFRDGGWMGLAFPEEYGGQGLPRTLALSVMEMIHASNMAFGLCPLLSFGAIEALIAHGTDQQKSDYLPKLVSGEWTGTMNLTEPQAGSDVGALKTKAEPQSDGSYRITGQKIYITWGDHDVTDNIIHLVLARLPDAPEGSKGVSLFLVPKFLLNEDGEPADRNDVRCIGLETKLGIHASPTCVMEFGGNDGATGWLIGQENQGLACMFTMMNSARLNVGLEGVAAGDAAYQAAFAYAHERKQGRAESWSGDGSAPIIYHSDIKRTLLAMRAKTMAARAICLACGIASDLSEAADTAEAREAAKLREELLTPIAKAWSTDMGVEVASMGVQVHGGMGFMGETLASQIYRDSRIAPIYEGTNGIQAIDLVGRKLKLAGGAAMQDMVSDLRSVAEDARATNEPIMVDISNRLLEAVNALEDATAWMGETMKSARDEALAGASEYLELAGDVIGGGLLIEGVLKARSADETADFGPEYGTAQITVAAFYADTVLASVPGNVDSITKGSGRVVENADQLFDLA